MNDRSFDLYTVNGGFSSKEHKTSKLSLCNEESFNCVNQIGAQSSMSAFNTKSLSIAKLLQYKNSKWTIEFEYIYIKLVLTAQMEPPVLGNSISHKFALSNKTENHTKKNRKRSASCFCSTTIYPSSEGYVSWLVNLLHWKSKNMSGKERLPIFPSRG